MKKLLAWTLLIACAGCDAEPSRPPTDSNQPEDKPKAKDSAPMDLDGGNFIEPPAALLETLGVDPYPGAKVMKSFSTFKQESAKRTYLDVIFFTRDPASKVAEFYKARLPEAKVVAEDMRTMNLFALDGKNSHGDKVRIQAQSAKEMTNFHVIITRPK